MTPRLAGLNPRKVKARAVRKLNKFVSIVISPPIVRNTDETLTKMIHERASISRFGDGEFKIMRGRGISFQKYDYKLSQRLREIIVTDDSRILIGIPDVFSSTGRFTDNASKYWTEYLNEHRYAVYKMLNRRMTYYDSLVTRLYMDYRDKSGVERRFHALKQIWKDRDLVIIEGAGSRLGMGNALFGNAKSIERICCPSVNAFAAYDDILDEAKKCDKAKLVLIALGPSATVLAYDLAKLGYQALDIGHIDIEYEWFINQSLEKTAVKNKYVNEVAGGAVSDEYCDDDYNTQVITRILLS